MSVRAGSPTRRRRSVAVRLAFLLTPAVLGSTACTVGPDYVRPQAPKVESYTRRPQPAQTPVANGKAQSFAKTAVPHAWWRLFKSSALDRAVDQALSSNPTLSAALANLRESQANLNAGYGVFYPQLNASAGASYQRYNPSSVGVRAPSSTFSLFTLVSSISYALDLFGGNRRAVEGLRAEVDVQRNAVLAAYLTLTSNVVNTVIAKSAYEAEIAATQEVIHLQREEVSVTRAQVESGRIAYTGLLSLASQLAATEATLPPLEQSVDQARHLLATLSGQAPASFSPPQVSLAGLTLPERLPVTLPAELVRQRPDIRQAEATLHAASAQIGVATAALYPSLSLTGSIGLNSSSLNRLVAGNSIIWSLGANLTAPLFRGGELRSKRQAAMEAFDASAAHYREVVLAALAQVADTLRALVHDARTLEAESRAVQAAVETQKLVDVSYRAGRAGYLDLIVANVQLSRAKLGEIQAQARRLQDTVALFVALGGGWWNSPKPLIDTLEITTQPRPGAPAKQGP